MGFSQSLVQAVEYQCGKVGTIGIGKVDFVAALLAIATTV